jgi:hypothetical protein
MTAEPTSPDTSATDAVEALGDLDEKPLSEHVAAFERAYAALAGSLDDAGTDSAGSAGAGSAGADDASGTGQGTSGERA